MGDPLAGQLLLEPRLGPCQQLLAVARLEGVDEEGVGEEAVERAAQRADKAAKAEAAKEAAEADVLESIKIAIEQQLAGK